MKDRKNLTDPGPWCATSRVAVISPDQGAVSPKGRVETKRRFISLRMAAMVFVERLKAIGVPEALGS